MEIQKNGIERYDRIIIITVLAASVLRILFYLFMDVDINCDEAMLSINANSIANTGKDIYGTSFPVYFEAWSYGGQSALPTYLCALFIRVFGNGIKIVRLPFVLISCLSIFFFYKLNRLLFNKREALIALVLLTICPWHIVQQMIALDCNMFPHVFIIGLYFLVKGMKNKSNINIYISMIILALTLYCYGVAIFFVPVFLLVIGIKEICNKSIRVSTFLISILVFTVAALPILLFYFINFLGIKDLSLGIVSIHKMIYQNRSSDLLFFSKYIDLQLGYNTICLLKTLVLQKDYCIWNYVPWFGTIYIVSGIFVLLGLIKRNNDTESVNRSFYLVIWFAISFVLGLIIDDTNINRLNIIWYVMIILCARGIESVIDKFGKKARGGIQVLYSVLFIAFICCFIATYSDNVNNAAVFSRGYSKALKQVYDEDEVYISMDVCSSSDMLVYSYNEFGNDKEYHFDRKLMAYRDFAHRTDVFDFNDRITGVEIFEGMVLDKDTYIIGENELDKIGNISDFDIKEYGEYRVLKRFN